MKPLILAAVAALSIGNASAQTCQRIGDFTYCSNGTTMQHIGDFTYINRPQTFTQPYQAPRVCQHIGQFTYCN